MVVGYVRQVSARCPRGKHKYTMSADSIYKVIAGSVRGALSYRFSCPRSVRGLRTRSFEFLKIRLQLLGSLSKQKLQLGGRKTKRCTLACVSVSHTNRREKEDAGWAKTKKR